MTRSERAGPVASIPMRRSVLVVVLGTALAVTCARPAAAQQDEEEIGELDPSDLVTTTTLAEEPVDPGEVVVVDSTTPPPTTSAEAATTTTLPPGCEPPADPLAVFSGTLVAADSRTARFEVEQLTAGDLTGYQVDGLVDVDFYDDTRFLVVGDEYLVAVEVDSDTQRLRSRAQPAPELFGGNQVVGVDDATSVCPIFADPAITKMSDGASVETGLLSPLLAEKRDILWSVLRPALIVLGVLVGLVFLKRTLLWIGRMIRRAWRSAMATQAAASARARNSSTA